MLYKVKSTDKNLKKDKKKRVKSKLGTSIWCAGSLRLAGPKLPVIKMRNCGEKVYNDAFIIVFYPPPRESYFGYRVFFIRRN